MTRPAFGASTSRGRGLRPHREAVTSLVKTSADKLLRPTWVEISLLKLRRNFERVRKLASKGSPRKVMAVVKADAYGHGALPVARTLAECAVDWFGVATVEEALELRAAGIEQPVLLLGGLYMSDPAQLLEYRLTPSVSSTARLDTYAECARRSGQTIEFHLKVDTGMGRLGLPPERLASFVEHYRQLKGLQLKGFFTHLASAEDLVASQTDDQSERFIAALSELSSFKINQPPEQPEFEPILTFKSRVVYLKDVPSGTPLGYGGAFHTRRRSRIATVPVGYADGLSRALSGRGRAIIRDRSARIVGNISMDLTLLDVTDIPGVDVGDEVILLGRSDHCSITALEIAHELGTVPYEILCSIGKRVPRIYVD
ncbi:MAG: alanine racemase [Acidobacteria bacterium]|nr:MAG: alanine racemase [Acidobacteriota bacterium]